MFLGPPPDSLQESVKVGGLAHKSSNYTDHRIIGTPRTQVPQRGSCEGLTVYMTTAAVGQLHHGTTMHQ